MKRLLFEQKIIGNNLTWISIAFVGVLTLLAFLCGGLLNLSCIGFEVMAPFFAAIAVGECGRTRADANFDIIASQGRSLFSWVLLRFTTVFLTVGIFTFIGMVIVLFIRNEMPLGEMVLLYIAPAFLLSTLCTLCGFCFAQEHLATMICGIIWIVTMLTGSLLRYTGPGYVYLFIRYAGDPNGVWLINKVILSGLSLVLWAVIYLLCGKRVALNRR